MILRVSASVPEAAVVQPGGGGGGTFGGLFFQPVCGELLAPERPLQVVGTEAQVVRTEAPKVEGSWSPEVWAARDSCGRENGETRQPAQWGRSSGAWSTGRPRPGRRASLDGA